MALFTPEGLVSFEIHHLDDEEPLPATGRYSVSSKRAPSIAERDRLAAVRVRTDEELGRELVDAPAVLFVMDALTDGRVFSQAHVLRARLQYQGPVWISGPMIPDQMGMALRCGVDGVEVPDDVDPEPWTRAARRFRHCYQTAIRQPRARAID